MMAPLGWPAKASGSGRLQRACMILWALRNSVIGAAIGCIAFAIYSHEHTATEPAERAVADRPVRAAAPDPERSALHRSIAIRAGRDGHYALDARVNGTTIRFLVDTGATSIVLRQEDAKRAGLHVRDHNFTARAQTANGLVRIAPVVLRDLRIGSLTVRNVEAFVNEGPLHQSLLGMDFLRRLDGYEVTGDKLILHW